ncbi:MAG: type 1 glutamine amidotransferase [Bacteroidota bacterium]|jgi:GMP synthase-like glutamine amidotransferase|nr:GMP synthase [Chitinophagaceae bacterium]MCE2758906.1 GMP synthase [Chitinophagaceae bacterium]
MLKIAVLDLNEGVKNEGMRCIREILERVQSTQYKELSWQEFEVRQSMQIPSLEFDVYISSGGPGSPLESKNTPWENAYFNWLDGITRWNNDPSNLNKKYVFLICHSFQLACRFFEIAEVIKRKSTSFGVFPIHMLKQSGNPDPLFNGLQDPFYGVDSRDYQVVQPDKKKVHDMGGEILCIEKERPHIPLERAVMAIRFNPYMVGTQFHPEADAAGMSMYLMQDEKKKNVIENYGQEKWESMIKHLNDPDKICLTNSQILPNFLLQAIADLNNPYSLS